MMKVELCPIAAGDLSAFKKAFQEAFQQGFRACCADDDGQLVLPEEDLDQSLAAPGAVALKAMADGRMVGGAIVVIDGSLGHLDFLYVQPGLQGQGVGQIIWQEIEQRFPAVTLWETCTPYFDRRNLHFYINCLKFHAVEFYNSRHPDPDLPQAPAGHPEEECFFRFEKRRP